MTTTGPQGGQQIDTSNTCAKCLCHGQTTGELLACLFWNSFVKAGDSCVRWRASK